MVHKPTHLGSIGSDPPPLKWSALKDGSCEPLGGSRLSSLNFSPAPSNAGRLTFAGSTNLLCTKATRTNKSFIGVLWSAWSDGVVAHWVELIALEVEAAISSFTDLGPPQTRFTRSCVCPKQVTVDAPDDDNVWLLSERPLVLR